MVARKGSEGGVAGGLKTVYQDISNLALEPDAGQYGQLIEGLRQAVLKAIDGIQQQKAQQAAQMGQMQRQQAINPMMGGQRPPGPGGPQGPQPGQPGGPPSQGPQGMSMPNPDELARLLSQAS